MVSSSPEYVALHEDVENHGRNSIGSTDTVRPEDVPLFREQPRSRMQSLLSILAYVVALVVGSVIVFEAWDLVATLEHKLDAMEMNAGPVQSVLTCTEPAIRRSWSTLDRQEKLEYIRAVKCLAKRPSYINPNSTVYDDFSYIHILNGNAMHLGSGNMPWHRLHLHLYEQALRNDCGYNGYQVYWAWEEESEDPVNSVFFDNEIGFGGNGNTTGPSLSFEESLTRIDKNRCLVDGPFKDFQPQWYGRLSKPAEVDPYVDPVFDPHCITRSFTDAFKDPEAHAAGFPPIGFNKAAIEKLLEIEDYSEFNLAAEAMHSWLPVSVGGDYMSLAAPNDPTFYPHLTNMDRLWWKWQQQNAQRHAMAYNGATYRLSSVNASLDDVIPFRAYPGMEKPIRVRDMMDTENGYLCYRY